MGSTAEPSAQAGRARWTSAPQRRSVNVDGPAPRSEPFASDVDGDLFYAVGARARRAGSDAPAIAALVAAAKELAEHWAGRHLATQAARAAFDEASDTERRARRDVAAVLAVVDSILDGESGAVSARQPVRSESRIPAAERAASGSHRFVARLLGPFEVCLDHRQIDTSSSTKSFRILRYLIASRPKAVPRDQLIDLFWPDVDIETGRRNLHQAVYVIRKALRTEKGRPAAVLFERDAYAMNPEVALWCDVDAFEREMSSGQQAELDGRSGDAERHFIAAIDLYRGDYLEDTLYEDWALVTREHYQLAFLEASHRVAQLAFDRGDLSGALATTQRTLRREPADEGSHRLAMRLHAAMGEQSLLARQYRSCSSALATAYDATPSEDTTRLFAELRSANST